MEVTPMPWLLRSCAVAVVVPMPMSYANGSYQKVKTVKKETPVSQHKFHTFKKRQRTRIAHDRYIC